MDIININTRPEGFPYDQPGQWHGTLGAMGGSLTTAIYSRPRGDGSTYWVVMTHISGKFIEQDVQTSLVNAKAYAKAIQEKWAERLDAVWEDGFTKGERYEKNRNLKGHQSARVSGGALQP
jgi:hypothetical protein